MNPVVIVNLKAYKQGTGESAARIASVCHEFGAWVSVQAVDIRLCAKEHPHVLAQHVDPVSFGAHTGHVLCEAVQQAGAVGSLVNHAEKKLSDEQVFACVEHLRSCGMMSVVCAESLERARALSACNPDYIALELPELIGGDVSIISARPGIVSEAVSALSCKVLLGAGVSSGEDLALALSQGAHGVLLASAVVSKTDNPRSALKQLYSAL